MKIKIGDRIKYDSRFGEREGKVEFIFIYAPYSYYNMIEEIDIEDNRDIQIQTEDAEESSDRGVEGVCRLSDILEVI